MVVDGCYLRNELGSAYISIPAYNQNQPYYHVTLIDLESDQLVWGNFQLDLRTSTTENKNI